MDLVYTYVNSNDTEWLKKRNEYANDNYNQKCRFRDNDELKYSLRSVEKYAPWIDNILIFTDSKTPDWLDLTNPRIRIIKHEDVMPKDVMPCYNSYVIESYIAYIENLSDCFIYANDDMMFGNYVSEDFFVKNGRPIVRVCEGKYIPHDSYTMALANAERLFFNKYGISHSILPWHNIDVYLKQDIIECIDSFKSEFNSFRNNHLRKETDIERIIFHYYMMYKNHCEVVTYKTSETKLNRYYTEIKKCLFPMQYLDYYTYNIHQVFSNKRYEKLLNRGPKVMCINDSEDTSDNDLKRYQKLMDKKFPQKSEFEK